MAEYELEWAMEDMEDRKCHRRSLRNRRTGLYGFDTVDEYDHYGLDQDDDFRAAFPAMSFGR